MFCSMSMFREFQERIPYPVFMFYGEGGVKTTYICSSVSCFNGIVDSMVVFHRNLFKTFITISEIDSDAILIVK